MQAVLANFIRALRSADVPVSTTESIDAAQTAAFVGYEHRDVLRTSMQVVLGKSQEEKETVGRIFDLFFHAPDPATSESQQQQSDGTNSENGSGEQSGSAEHQIVNLAQSTDPNQIQLALAQAGEQAGVSNIQFATQTAWFSRQIMQNLDVDTLEQELIARLQDSDTQSQERAQQLMDARSQIGRQAREFVEGQFEVFGRSATERFMDRAVSRRPLSAMDARDMARMKSLVQKMARKLATKYARRRRRFQRGRLDVRNTLRANAGHDFIPFDVRWRRKRRNRPKIVAICDVSSSVSTTVRFLLMFLYSLNETVADIETFAFSNRLYNVEGYLNELDFDTAMKEIIKDAGSGSTDYGQTLVDLKSQYWSSIDRTTTVLILGDGRSNYSEPRIEILAEAAARSKRLVWLSPEAPYQWGTGDSYLLRYQAHCSQLTHCATADDLARAIDQILATYD